MAKSNILTLVMLVLSVALFGQKLSTKSPKAEKLFEEASYHITYMQYFEAEEKLEKCIKTDPNFFEAFLLMGDLHADLNEPEAAAQYYRKALKINPDSYPRAHYFLGKLLISKGNYQSADSSFRKYLTYPGIDDYSKRDTERQILNCNFAITSLQNPVEFTPMNMGNTINSNFSEYFPTMSVDGKTILYTRLIAQSVNQAQEDFFMSITDKNGFWYPSQNVGRPLNTPMNEGAATISADGNTIIFTACEQNGFYGEGREGYGSCDLFFTRKRNGKWMQPVNLGAPVNTSNWESQPSLSSNGEALYFVRGVTHSDRRESDIFVSNLDAEGYWSKPDKISPAINTEESEESVLIHPDNNTLYFSSRGHVGMGGSDIFMSKRNPDGSWGEPLNLGYPINTYGDENSLLVNPNGEIGYLASDREGGFGLLDIYAFDIPESLQADPVSYFKGVVYDSLTRQLLAARIELIDIESGNRAMDAQSDGNNGEFFVALIPHHNYIVNISKEGYLFFNQGIFIKENKDILKPFVLNIPLIPIEVGNKLVLNNIFFATDKSEIMSESFVELNKLVDFLKSNPTISVEIGGHTDNQGNMQHNKQLSENRAKAVYEYLVSKEIAAGRLKYKGYSFEKPVDSNDTEEGRAKNRRTEFTILQK